MVRVGGGVEVPVRLEEADAVGEELDGGVGWGGGGGGPAELGGDGISS